MSRVRMTAAALAVCAPLLLSACWPQAGQNPDRTAHNVFERRLTASTVPALAEAWHRDVGGTVTAPAFVGGDVLVGGSSELRRLDVATGAVEWAWTAPPDGTGGPGRQFDPAVVGDKVLAVTSTYEQGQTFGSVGTWLDPVSGAPVTGPALSSGAAAVRWPFVATQRTSCPEGQCGYRFGVLNAETSAVLALGYYLGGPLTLGGHALYVINATYDGSWTPTLAALPIDGSLQNTCGSSGLPVLPCPTWSTVVGGRPTAAVIGPGESAVYAGTSAGSLVALDAASGTILWSTAVGAAVTQPPALAEGVLYAGTGAGDVVAVDATTGAVRWRASVGAAAVATQPAVGGSGADAVVYAATTAGDVAALAAAGCGAATCSPLWSGATGAPVTVGPVVANGTLVVGTDTPDGPAQVVAYRLPPAAGTG